jgi:hypothetical protein
LLIEEQRTNLLTYSSDFSNAVWSATGLTVTSAATIAPDGSLTGQKAIPTTVSANHLFNRLTGVTTVIGTAYTTSWFAKKGEYNFCKLQLQSSAFSINSWANFNLNTGTVATVGGSGTASIVNIGNGWYRCIFSDTATANQITGTQNFVLPSDTNSVITGDGYSGIYILGTQLEQGSFPTSYIPTTSAQVTRNADQASMTGTNFSSWYNQSQGSFYAQIDTNAISNIAILGGSSSTFLGYWNGAGILSTYNGTSVLTGNVGLGGKVTMTYSTAGRTLLGNGGSAVSDTSLVGSNSQILLGVGASGGAYPNALNGHIRKLTYYPQALSSQNLVALTS